MTFSELLALLMERRGVTSAELADAIGVDPSYVRRLVSGARIPVRAGPDLISRISSALDLPPQQTEGLHTKFQEALSTRQHTLRSSQDFLDNVISRIVGPPSDEQSGALLPRKPRVRQVTSEIGSYGSLAWIARQFSGKSHSEVYVYLPDEAFASDDRSVFLNEALREARRIYHFVADLDENSKFIEVIESVFRISDMKSGRVDAYRPIQISLPGVPAFLACESQVILMFGIGLSGQVLAVTTNEEHTCRLVCRILGLMYRKGREFVEFFDERDPAFQERLFDIELSSSTRRGVFDEGPSFLTHPPQWYSDNSSFEDRAPWRKMPLGERRKYKGRLRQRLTHATEFMDIEEIVSESSMLQYIRGGLGGDDFYEGAFPLEYISEHIRHMADLIRSPKSRYKLFIAADRGIFISNKSWAAYNDHAFLDKVSGGENQAIVFSSVVIANGFREVFESAKRTIMRKFLDASATADWLLARLSERAA